jgi:hypothetical protein
MTILSNKISRQQNNYIINALIMATVCIVKKWQMLEVLWNKILIWKYKFGILKKPSYSEQRSNYKLHPNTLSVEAIKGF